MTLLLVIEQSASLNVPLVADTAASLGLAVGDSHMSNSHHRADRNGKHAASRVAIHNCAIRAIALENQVFADCHIFGVNAGGDQDRIARTSLARRSTDRSTGRGWGLTIKIIRATRRYIPGAIGPGD